MHTVWMMFLLKFHRVIYNYLAFKYEKTMKALRSDLATKFKFPGSMGNAPDKSIDVTIGLRCVKGPSLIRRDKVAKDKPAVLYLDEPDVLAQHRKQQNNESNIICTNKLRIGTWNIWFGNERQEERMDKLMSIIDKENIDIFCFQEVTQSLLSAIYDYLIKNETFKHYYVSGIDKNDLKAYGNVIFSKYPINKVYYLDFTAHDISHMSRQLVCCDFLLAPSNVDNDENKEEKAKDKDKNKEENFEILRMGNVHLESLDPNKGKRQLQIEMAYNFMCNKDKKWGKNISDSVDHLMIMGDFNECGTINVSKGLKLAKEFKDAWVVDKLWNKNKDKDKEKEDENKGDESKDQDNSNEKKNKNGDVPVYSNKFGKEVKRIGDDPILTDPGWTMPARGQWEAWRPDRLIYSLNRNKKDSRAWKLNSINIVGQKPFPDEKAASQYSIETPSDHYGLVVEFERC